MKVFGQTILKKFSCGLLSWATAVPVLMGLCSDQPCLTEKEKDFHPSPQLSGCGIALRCLHENKLF